MKSKCGCENPNITGGTICNYHNEMVNFFIRRLRSAGGKSKSPKKVKASRLNGKKGGRPKKEPELLASYIQGK